MRQCAPSAAAGRLHKGSLDIAKLEPAIRGTPVAESYHARVFAPVLSNRIRESHLTIYEFMKPTSQISHSQHASPSLPLTNSSFQPTADSQTSSSAGLPAR